MAVGHDKLARAKELSKARSWGYGLGLLKGMFVTIKHLFSHNTVIEYPDEKQDLSPRTRGVIALKEENCTVCMLCGRECPDWCIYIDSHKETLPPKREGGRPRKRNVLDRFAIDYALCMYCGICVEVCPYDALFWSREFEYAEYDIRELTHEKERLTDWMATVLPPPPLEAGAELPGQAKKEAAAVAAAAPAAGEGAPGAKPAPATAAAPAPAPPPAPAPTPAKAPEAKPPPTPEPAPAAKPPPAPEPAPTAESGPNVEVPHEARRPIALERTEDPEEVYRQVLDEQKEKGSSPQVAEARARVARVKAERGIKRGPTPVQVDKPVPSAPTKHGSAEQDKEPPPPDIGEEKEGPIVDPGEPPDTGETVPDKIVEKVTDEPQTDDKEPDAE